MKVTELLVEWPTHGLPDEKEGEYSHVKSAADIKKALQDSLLHDWITVDLEAVDIGSSHDEKPKHYDELIKIIKKITKIKPKNRGFRDMTTNVYDSAELKRLLDAFSELFGPGEWPWAITTTNWDFG